MHSVYHSLAGGELRHLAEELAALGLLSFAGRASGGKTAESADQGTRQPSQQTLVQAGPGLAALPKTLVDRIRANEFIDFMELPPARSRSRSSPQATEGQILVVQAADFAQGRKTIPDLTTWIQCFALYTAILTQEQPERYTDLMAYQSIMAKASQRYRWPSWVIYDQSFRQERAGTLGQSWARVDPSIYSLCFTGQTISTENWCANFQSIDHTLQTCPARPRKRSWSAMNSPSQQQHSKAEICRKFNQFAGDCKYGKDCKFRHVCSSCGDPHPVSRCKTSEKPRGDGPPH